MACLSESAAETCAPLWAAFIELQVRVYCCHLLEGESEAKCSFRAPPQNPDEDYWQVLM